MQTEFVVPLSRYACTNCKVTCCSKKTHHLFTTAGEHMIISILTGKHFDQQYLIIYLNVTVQ